MEAAGKMMRNIQIHLVITSPQSVTGKVSIKSKHKELNGIEMRPVNGDESILFSGDIPICEHQVYTYIYITTKTSSSWFSRKSKDTILDETERELRDESTKLDIFSNETKDKPILNHNTAQGILDVIAKIDNCDTPESDQDKMLSFIFPTLTTKYEEDVTWSLVIFHFFPYISCEKMLKFLREEKVKKDFSHITEKAAEKLCSLHSLKGSQELFRSLISSVQTVQNAYNLYSCLKSQNANENMKTMIIDQLDKWVEKKNVEDLKYTLTFWKAVSEDNMLRGKTSVSLNLVVKAICYSNENSTKPDTQLLKEVVDMDIHKEEGLGVRILEALAKSDNKDLHELCFVILSGSDLDVLKTSDVETVAVEWMYSTIRINSKSKARGRQAVSDYIPKIFKSLGQLLELQIVKKNGKLTETIKEKAHKRIPSTPLVKLMEMVNEMTNMSSETWEAYIEYVQKHITSDDRIIQSCVQKLRDKETGLLKLHVHSKKLGELMTYILDCVSLNDIQEIEEKPTSEFEGCVRSIFRHAALWITLRNAEGQYNTCVHEHQAFKKAEILLNRTAKEIEDFTIDHKLLKSLLDITSKQTQTYKLLEAFHSGKDAAYWEAVFDNVDFALNEVNKKGKWLQALYVLLKEFDDKFDIADLEDFESQLTIKTSLSREKDNPSSVEQASENSFWGMFANFIDIAEVLYDFSDIKSFLQFSKKKIMKYKLVSPYSCHMIAQLSGEFAEKFKKKLFTVVSNEDDLPIEMVWEIFEDVQYIENDLRTAGRTIKDQHKDAIKISSRKKKWLRDLASYQDVYHKVIYLQQAMDILNMTMLDEEERKLMEFKEKCENRFTGFTLYGACREINQINELFKDYSYADKRDIWDIVKWIGQSEDLFSFLQGIPDEDLRFMTNATEEHSEHKIDPSVVKDLITVHHTVLNFDPMDSWAEISVLDFLQKIEEWDRYTSDFVAKIISCADNVHALKFLYHNVANRGKLTKEIVASALETGTILFELHEEEHKYTFYLKYDYYGPQCCDMQELFDHRGRALLLANGKLEEDDDGNQTTQRHDKENMLLFVEVIETCQMMMDTLSSLHKSGHFKFQHLEAGHQNDYSTKFEPGGLKLRLQRFQKELENWSNALESARSQFHSLNLVRGDQLRILKCFFQKGENAIAARKVLDFIHPRILQSKGLAQILGKLPMDSGNLHSDLCQLGKALDKLIFSVKPVPRKPTHNPAFKKEQVQKMDDQVNIVKLEKGENSLFPTILKLYDTKVQSLPKQHQLMYCHRDTSWEEIKLLVNRCFHKKQVPGLDEIFCIANVDVLASEMKFGLIDELQKLLQSSENQMVLDSRLYMVGRFKSNDPISEYFDKNICKIKGYTSKEMETILQRQWPKVFTITSAVPGCGKSDFVTEKFAKENRNVVPLKLYGPLSFKTLVESVAKLEVEDHQVLHIDVGMTPDLELLDAFFFHLIVLGTVTSGTKLTTFQSNEIAIEIANSLENVLWKSLQFLHGFRHESLKWENYRNLKVSEENHSSVQVVCRYLNVLDVGKVNGEDIKLIGNIPITEARCKELLAKYNNNNKDMSFSIAWVFLEVLADQLKKMSASPYFRVETIEAMLGANQRHTIRETLLKALIQMSKEFAQRSVGSCRTGQKLVLKEECEMMTDRLKGMLQWEGSNHLMIVFHSNAAMTISALYRDPKIVPENIKKLLKSQLGEELKHFNDFDQKMLQFKIRQIVQVNGPHLVKEEAQNLVKQKIKGLHLEKKGAQIKDTQTYALTPDNLLKMVLISLRIKAGVPVILMGETGCGKTSLVKYLAEVSLSEYKVFNFHAGITEKKILECVTKLNKSAEELPKGKKYWLFLDEINTCEHLGLLSEIVCHHSCRGVPLSRKLVLMAACNPYRLRAKEQILTCGLKAKSAEDHLSRLVYRVYPLPESMIDYVWDYGTLNSKDEEVYIKQMMKDVFPNFSKKECIPKLLIDSQNFIRVHEKSTWSTSLRDVQRCKMLMTWFYTMLKEKVKHIGGKRKDKKQTAYEKPENEYFYHERSILLALAHCYCARIPTNEKRRELMRKFVMIFDPTKVEEKYIVEEAERYEKVIRMEQNDLLDRMSIQRGIAKNTALRENVFVLLVSILNKIPVFVVGKPGCSKSLSIELITSNLRGRDSKDGYFKTLPKLYPISYQGSESSTSEGIEKVFEKANEYLNSGSGEDILPMVVLDEIGLAEVSRFNPLKVLHELLEPDTGKTPDVAVVGISNWALDAAKMNRAVHLSRPDLDMDELLETAMAIGCDFQPDLMKVQKECMKKLFKALASAYCEYQDRPVIADFHGLRDYYALVKYVSKDFNQYKQDNMESKLIEKVIKGIFRNFGGLPEKSMDFIVSIFETKITEAFNKIRLDFFAENGVSQLDLIKENLSDAEARYLMLISDGDVTVDIVENLLKDKQMDYEVIIGSHFEEDQTEDYSYRVLSQIILCMEKGVVLVLKDLDHIFGSLYEMFNQNYTRSGNKMHCRVALGPYSNPICTVHKSFRCVVMMDKAAVEFADPPFLNRFEKQSFCVSAVLTKTQNKMAEDLKLWIGKFTEAKQLHFKKEQCFLGFSDDVVSSLVETCWKGDLDEANIRQHCQDKLMMLATPDGVQRAQSSYFGTKTRNNLKEVNGFFNKMFHKSLKYCLQNMSQEYPILGTTSARGRRLVIFTHSNFHTDIKSLLTGGPTATVERLSNFKSERQLTYSLNRFFSQESDTLLFVLQCKLEDDDAENLLLARHHLETLSDQYGQEADNNKQVVFIVHVQRNSHPNATKGHFTFYKGWCMVTVDLLEEARYPLALLREKPLLEMLNIQNINKEIMLKHLLWAFSCIRYTGSHSHREHTNIMELIQKITASEHIVRGLASGVLQAVEKSVMEEKNTEDTWQTRVACSTESIGNAASFWMALWHHLEKTVKIALSKLIYKLEVMGVLDWVVTAEEEEQLSLFEEWVSNPSIIHVKDVQQPTGAECYIVEKRSCSYTFPFFLQLEEHLRDVNLFFAADVKQLKQKDEHLDESGMLTPQCLHGLVSHYQDIFMTIIGDVLIHPYLQSHLDDYTQDLLLTVFSIKHSRLYQQQSVKLLKWILDERAEISKADNPAETFVILHIAVWYFKPLLQEIIQLVSVCSTNILETGNLVEKIVATKDLEKTHQEAVHANVSLQNLEERIEGNSSGHIYRSQNEQSNSEKKEWNREDTDLPTARHGKLHMNIAIEEDASQHYSSTERKELNIDEERAAVSDNMTAEETLVDYLCNEMLPTSRVIEHCDGIDKWHKQACMLQAFAETVSCYPSSFCLLTVCADLAGHIVIPYSIDKKVLVQLGDMGVRGTGSAMSSAEVLQYLFEMTSNLVQSGKVPVDNCQMFLCQCLDTILDNDPDIDVIQEVLTRVMHGAMPDHQLVYFGPILKKVLLTMGSDSDCFNIFCKFVCQGVVEDGCEVLKYMDDVIQNPNETNKAFLVILVDLIEDIVLQEIPRDLSDDVYLNKTALDLLFISSRKVIEMEKTSLRTITAIAFTKAILNAVAKLSLTEVDVRIMKQTDAALDSGDGNIGARRKAVLVGYLLHALKSDRSYKNLRDRAEELSSHMSVLLDVEWSMKETILSLGYNPLAGNPNFPNIVQAWTTFCTERKDQDLQSFLQKCSTSPSHFIGFLGFVMNSYTLIKPVRPIKDTEKQQMNYITENTAKLCFSWRLAIAKLLGKSDFNCQLLQLSEQSMLNQQQQASVLYHLMAVVVAHNPMGSDMNLPKNAPILAQCMLTPGTANAVNLSRWISVNLGATSLERYDEQHQMFITKCKCDHLNISRLQKLECPVCNTENTLNLFDSEKGPYAMNTRQPNETEPKTATGSIPSFCDDVDGKSMSPLGSRLLGLLVNGSLLLSYALGLWPEKHLDFLMGLSREVLCSNYLSIWAELGEVLDETNDGLCRFLHMIIDELCPLIASEKNPCSTPEVTQKFEHNFNQIVERNVTNATQKSHSWYVNTCRATGYNPDGMESILGEVTNHEENDITTVLYRKKGCTSLKSLQTVFRLQHKEKQTPFLGFVLDHLRSLSLLGHLSPLLQWQREVNCNLNKRLRKNQMKEYTIEQFLCKSTKDSNGRKQSFENFAKSWNELRKPENGTALGLDDQFMASLPRMDSSSFLKTCLITDVKSPLMIMVKALMSVQNTTILQALRIALRAGDSSAAVGFYRSTNECTAAPCVYLQDASEKELMDFKWKEEHLAFSQFNTGLGMGSEVIYDFKKIERVVASSLLHGKSFLVLDENFPWFNFSGQLFCEQFNILQDLAAKVPQKNISQATRDNLIERKNNSPQYAADLLTQLELVIPHILKFNSDDPTCSLYKYAETWYGHSHTLFPVGQLPGVHGDIQLAHIVHLYECTEDLLLDNVAEGLGDRFREPLPQDSTSLKDFITTQNVTSTQLQKTVGRLIKRYVCPNEDTIDVTECLHSLIQDPGLWTDGINTYRPQKGVNPRTLEYVPFPNDLRVCHIHSVYDFIKDLQFVNKQSTKVARPTMGTFGEKMGARLPGRLNNRKRGSRTMDIP